MKKIYITPALTNANIEMKVSALEGSVTAPGQGIGYGGVDEGGTMDPESKRRGFGSSILDGDDKKDLW